MSETPDDVNEWLRQYRDLLITMDAGRVERGGKPSRWNRLVDEMQRLQLRLRASEAGRADISRLASDENQTVRMWAATHALAWDEAARGVLEREADGDDLSAFEAEVTLREFDAGRLDTAWQPKKPRRA